MNFNISKKPEYALQARLTNELINLYGVQSKLVIVQKMNKDDLVFGDYSHIKVDNDQIHEIYVLPETSESWDNINVNFVSGFLSNSDSANVFVSRKTVDIIFGNFDEGVGFSNIVGNIIVLPSGRIMEITDIQFETPGVNNLYTYNDQKNAYKFTLKTFSRKTQHENISAAIEPESYETLESYFAELVGEQESVDALVSDPINPIVSNEDSVFGRF